MVRFQSGLCPPVSRRSALEIVYQQVPQPHRDEQIGRLLDPHDSPVSMDGLLACFGAGGALCGAMLTSASPGRVLMAWPPKTARAVSVDDQETVLRSLLWACRAEGERQQARFIQLLSDRVEPRLTGPLADAGFAPLTQLVYLRRPVGEDLSLAGLPVDIEIVPYREDLRELFLQLLADSYHESQDCPELTGVRSMNDIFESHRGTRAINPDYWLLVRQQDEWVGCLVLSETGEDILEISYVAVVPKARGRGLGRILTREAIRLADHEGRQAVVLAVDVRNRPALSMYEEEGFTPWDMREVHWALLDPLDGRPTASPKNDG